MKVEFAISLTQPWASLMALGAKLNETRGWRTGFRGWIALHAAKNFPCECHALLGKHPFSEALASLQLRTYKDMPLGAVIAVTQILDCRRTEDQVGHCSERE